MMTMASSPVSTLLFTAKSSGRCPPSLLGEDRVIDEGVFEMALLRSLEVPSQGMVLSSESSAVEAFSSALNMADSRNLLDSPAKSRVLEQRRCILLAVVGFTAETFPKNPSLRTILNAGFLIQVKAWLDEILVGSVGGMDLLLHLLSNIAPLPVTKEMVTTCRLGKAVVGILKHKICVGSPNEVAITTRVQLVKDRWSEAVKSLKNGANVPMKRQAEDDVQSMEKNSKRKVATPALSNILRKVESENIKSTSTAELARLKAQEKDAKLTDMIVATGRNIESNKEPIDTTLRKVEKHIRWADKSGKDLVVTQGKVSPPTVGAVESENLPDSRLDSSWSDRKKKDLMLEKEWLLQAKKNGSLDQDKEDMLNAMAMMTVPWRPPQPLPVDAENPPVHVDSKEVSVQNNRMKVFPAVYYATENLVPISPTLLSDVERALELTAMNTAPPNEIPFFAPKPVATAASLGIQQNALPAYPVVLPNVSTSSEATLETVLMMGLPLFLVGSNVQALQALAAAPGLLSTFRDANGAYDQQGLMNLIQTLTHNLVPPQASQVATASYGGGNPYQNLQNYYQTAPTQVIAQPSIFSSTFNNRALQPQQPVIQQVQPPRGYRGDQNLGEANLHLSGYGPTTTTEEIIALFAPYVHVVEVVPKNNFSFINTRDPEGAKRAKEALNGSLLGGMPCRINMATRKIKTLHEPMTAIQADFMSDLTSLPRNKYGQVDFDEVRDDRGNAATKNLFIAGYGPGTTEQQLRDLITQYATVISVVLKSTFAFVNTTDRDAAVIARQSLSGYNLNGGPLRINFAKESGRLGTSFDSTYGPASASYGRFR